MKKYRQILAGFLAINLSLSGVLTGPLTASASSETISSENIEATEDVQTSAEISTEPIVGSDSSVSLEAADSPAEDVTSDIQGEVAATEQPTEAPATEAPATEQPVTEPPATEPPATEAPVTEAPATEEPVTDTEAPATEPEQPSTETEAPTTETELPSTEPEEPTTDTEQPSTETEVPGTETETSDTETEEETTEDSTEDTQKIAVQKVDFAQTTLKLSDFKNYNNNTLTVNSEDAYKALILLSYCDPKDIQDLTISIKITGSGDIDLTKGIEVGDDLSSILNVEDSVTKATVNEEETEAESVVTAETMATDAVIDTDEPAADVIVIDPVVTYASNVAESQADETVASEDDTDNKIVAGKVYTFQGFGSKENPFQGTIAGSSKNIVIDRPFFNVLSSNAKISFNDKSNLMLVWAGTGDKAMIADIYQFDNSLTAETEHELNISVRSKDNKAAMGSLFGTVWASGELEIPNTQVLKIGGSISYADATVAVSSTGNAGLICNTLKNGMICLDGFSLPSSGYAVTSTSGNAGGLIGTMETGTTLKVNSAIETSQKITVTASSNAGGLVGEMESDAQIITGDKGSVSLTGSEITGSSSAGGIVGTATDVTFDGAVITIREAILKGSASGANVGGFVGKYILEKVEECSLSDNITIEKPSVLITGKQEVKGGNAGGYFGLLELNGLISYTIGGDAEQVREIVPKYRDNGATGGDAWSYGGLVGQVTTTDVASTLKIQNMTVNSTYPVYNTSHSRPKYHGGLVGYIGNENVGTYVEIKNVEVTVSNPHGTFGGAVGCLGEKSILKVNGIKVATKNGGQDAKIWDGGGVLGKASAGSVLELSGTTDLSGVNYERNDKSTGQLVGDNTNALIYARGNGNGTGWTYIRSKFASPTNGSTYNDLLCYGQVLRLKSNETSTGLSSDLITIEADHTVTLKKIDNLDLSTETITLGSADDFALLSIAWSSRGNFGGESGITTENWRSIKNSTITLSADIDLTGTGVMGLSRDTDTEEDTFSGTLNGDNEKHTITLDIGATYGFQGTSVANLNASGCGIVYATNNTIYHAAQGIFAKTEGATIKNLTMAGNISVSNAFGSIAAGGIAAQMQGTTTINGVTVQESIYADGSAEWTMSVGGLYGTENGGMLSLGSQTTAAPKITLKNVDARGSWICAGGVMGKASNSGFTLNVNDAVVGNSEKVEGNYAYITTDATGYAYVGGLIGLIKGQNSYQIEINNLTISGFKISADEVTEVSGGLLGSIWENVDVVFNSATRVNSQLALTVENSTVSAGKANGVGGLAYRSSGNWKINDYGIDIKSLKINSGGDVGLLVCRGEKGQTKYENKDVYTDIEALYLNTTECWATAYKLAADSSISITQSGTNNVFDEFVAHTAATAEKITENGKNGVVSIATSNNRVGVEESGANCTTYQNRTAYGKNKINACSRYYYDLDVCLSEVSNSNTKNNNQLDTAAELMLWSVYWYACENIRSYLGNETNTPDILVDYDNGIPTITDALDMQKYSYYPVNLATGVVIKDAMITFYNADIESAETGASNKSTQVENDSHSQHYTMHCGLFLNQPGDTWVSLDNVTFSGSIGKVNNDGSGVLFAGTVQGSFDTSMHTATIRLKDINFDGLKVNGINNTDDYAPLLINKIGSYATLDANGIKIKDPSKYTLGTAAATSLIGRVGTETSKQISLSFLDIILPDKWTAGREGIFTNATLLEWFKHDGTSSVATYNFNKSREWSGTTYTHGVTYGYEITETTEYPNLQLWYYDEAGYGSDDNRVHTNETDKTSFSSKNYLRYVHKEYSADDQSHEIKVNQRMDNIVDGCGTYGHPYCITTAREMQILSEYMSSGTAPEGWCVTITGNQSINHVEDGTEDNNYSGDVTYKYKGNHQWVKVTKEKGVSSEKWPEDENADTENVDNMMQDYLLSAYYDLQGTDHALELTDFGGFGNEANPFRGVLTSTGETVTTVALKGNAPANGLIGYGYGCVVKDLEISYEACTSKTLSNNQDETTTGSSGAGTSINLAAIDYYSKIVFGGVIGCVRGGDNIIDGVTVKYGQNWLTIDGNKKHLIPVGGYVGEVSGGGVIFRNLKSTDAGLTDNSVLDATSVDSSDSLKNMYVNPYVGRVLDGFAFYEVTKTGESAAGLASKLDNTEKNYQINTFSEDDKNCVTVTGSDTDQTVTANNAKGLLVLSAIVNSGAASNGVSNAYSSNADNNKVTIGAVTYSFGGKYGKVRNADYSGIGIAGTETDFALSHTDDCSVPGIANLPYLIKKYCGGNGGIFSLTDSMKIALSKDGSYDMSVFGTGYQGIGARYVSSAILDVSTVTPTGIVPNLVSFSGNGSTIILNMPVKEYVDDDFRAAAVGGVFNLFSVGSGSTVSNLTIQGKTDSSEVSLKYYDSNGDEGTKETNVIDVGGFAGTVSRIKNNSNVNVSFSSMKSENLKITGPRNAGGFLGSSITKSATSLTTLQVEEKLTYNEEYGSNNIGIALVNSEYDSLTVTADIGAGGCVGYIDSNSASFVLTEAKKTVGKDSTINSTHIYATTDSKDTASGAGGIFGYVKATVNINTNTDATVTYKKAIIQDVAVAANMYAGGFIGKIDGKAYNINLASVVAVGKKNEVLISTSVTKEATDGSSNERREGAGGIIGYAKGSLNSGSTIQNCSLNDAQINKSETATNRLNQNHEGAGGIIGLITDSKSVTIEGCDVTGSNIYGAVAGGIAGITKSDTIFKNCSVSGTSSEKKSNIKGRDTASGILGYWFSDKSGTLEDCHVKYVDIEAYDWGIGALIGDGDKTGGSLYLYDTSVQDSSVAAQKGGRWYQPGGIIGDLRSDLTASNLLFSGVEITMPANTNPEEHSAGLLVATCSSGKKIQIAGVSIQNIPENSKELELVGSGDYTGYIAFADYSGTALDSELQGDEEDNLLGATAKAPYVVTSPKSGLSLYESTNDKTAKLLYGDGVSWTGTAPSFTMTAQTIFKNKNESNSTHYAYSKMTVEEFDFTSAFSTYNTNQTTKVKNDFPVLQLSGDDTNEVEAYLDILTNGGFSEANKLNNSSNQYVEASADVYEYNNKKEGFVKQANTTGTKAFIVNTDSNKKISFTTTTDYDNNKDRFTLLTVTFFADSHTYSVFVPILVRRMLEIDFTATLTYGTDFRSEDYKGLENHVLESFGSSITGYLTYTYNSAKGTYSDYGWQSYIDAGGDLITIGKTISFNIPNVQKLPEGIQLTLVDEKSGRAYYYTTTGKEEYVTASGMINVPLSAFKNSDGTADSTYQEPSISELLNVEVKSEGGSLLFVKVDENGKPIDLAGAEGKNYPEPTVRIKNNGEYEYYRLADSSLEEKGKYSVTVAENKLHKTEGNKEKATVTENYYLVITVPKDTKSNALNGSIQTTVTSSMPNKVYYRKIVDDDDGHSNTASTFQLSEGYRHNLEETGHDGLSKEINLSARNMKVDVTDTITFPNSQYYNGKDQLYLRFVGALQKKVGETVTTEQFPKGTSGTAYFYVYTEDQGTKTYYTYSDTTWSAGQNKEVEAVHYGWISDGGNMELPLSTDGTIETAISLQQIRDKLAKGGETGDSSIYVEVKMEVALSTNGLDVIPESKLKNDSRPEDYTKFVYSAQLSTVSQSLSYSTNRAAAPSTTTEYYREEAAGAQLSYNALKTSQLGINILDLDQNLDESQSYSPIDTLAEYDLSETKNLEKTLGESSAIRFTLKLFQKDATNGNTEGYPTEAAKASDSYMNVQVLSTDSGEPEYDSDANSWSWTIQKDAYYDSENKELKTDGIFNGTSFTQSIQLWINISNVESAEHFYANYKVELTAEILDNTEAVMKDTSATDYIIYTLARIKPEFIGGSNTSSGATGDDSTSTDN